MTVTAPFRFARIARRVHLPVWGELVSHDLPFRDGASGEIRFEIVTQTPLLIGGRRRAGKKAGNDGPARTNEVWPFELEPGRYAIPGSTLQGLVRSILEIATFGRLGPHVDRKRFGIRDLLQGAAPIYQERLNDVRPLRQRNAREIDPRVQAGWLRRTSDGYQLRRCTMARIDYSELASLTNVPATRMPSRADFRGRSNEYREAWNRARNALQDRDWTRASSQNGVRYGIDRRYEWASEVGASLAHTLHVEEEKPQPRHVHRRGDPKGELHIAYRKAYRSQRQSPYRTAPKSGHLVVTGLTSNPPAKAGLPTKHMEFFFFDEGEPEMLDDFQPKFDEFLSIHEPDDGRPESPNWAYFRDTGYPGVDGPQPFHREEPGGWMPIFYLPDRDGGIDSFGLAYMFKVAHQGDTHQLLANSWPEHLEPDADADPGLDLPHLIFGAKADMEKQNGLKRRASFDMALGQIPPDKSVRRNNTPTVLLGPKPNYYPIYVRQPVDPKQKGRLPPDQPYASYTALDPNKYGREQAAPELAGVKIWPAVGKSSFPQLRPAPHGAQPQLTTHLNALPEEMVFSGTARFHNLRRVELGALIWALTFGNEDAIDGRFGTCCHKIGMGKPYHLGEVKIRLLGMELEPNDIAIDTAQRVPAEEWRPAALVDAFQRYMDRVCEGFATGKTWKNSIQVKALLKAARVDAGAGQAYSYMKLKENDPPQQASSYLQEKKERHFLPDYVDGEEFDPPPGPPGGGQNLQGNDPAPSLPAGPGASDRDPVLGETVYVGLAGSRRPGKVVELPKDKNSPHWRVDLGDGKKPRAYRRSLIEVPQ